MRDEADLQQRVAVLAVRAKAAEEERLGPIRGDAVACGFTQCFADFKRVFGDGVKFQYFKGHTGEVGRSLPIGVVATVQERLKKVKRC